MPRYCAAKLWFHILCDMMLLLLLLFRYLSPPVAGLALRCAATLLVNDHKHSFAGFASGNPKIWFASFALRRLCLSWFVDLAGVSFSELPRGRGLPCDCVATLLCHILCLPLLLLILHLSPPGAGLALRLCHIPAVPSSQKFISVCRILVTKFHSRACPTTVQQRSSKSHKNQLA